MIALLLAFAASAKNDVDRRDVSRAVRKELGRMYMMQTLRSVNDDATVSQRAGFAMFLASFGAALQPRPLTDAFSEGLDAFLRRLPAWAFWNAEIGAAQEARASADMVFRK